LFRGWRQRELLTARVALQILLRNTRTTDSLWPGGRGEFLARWCRACAACALFLKPRTTDSLRPGGRGEFLARWCRAYAACALDEYYPTWTEPDAGTLFGAVGSPGRAAYGDFSLRMDFWFRVFSVPVFRCSLLSLAFPEGKPGAWLNSILLWRWAADAAESIKHFTLAGQFPDLSSLQLAVGPAFSAVKDALVKVLPLAAVAGFITSRPRPGGGER
jgi:hypothetical protein